MRRLCFSIASAVVVAVTGWSVLQNHQNRNEPTGGKLHLTDRELPLQSVGLESSVTVLRLNWDTRRVNDKRFGPAEWLSPEKLKDLGFDCRVPLASPRAKRHYSSMPPRRAYLALQYHEAQTAPGGRTGLQVVDAAREPRLLRDRFPDPARTVICRGLVRVGLRTHDQDHRPLATPELQGWIDSLVPAQVSVPRPANGLLVRFLRTSDPDGDEPVKQPRFSAVVHWGRNYEPWVEEVVQVSPWKDP